MNQLCAAKQAARTSLKASAGAAGHPGQPVLHSCRGVGTFHARHSDQGARQYVKDKFMNLFASFTVTV